MVAVIFWIAAYKLYFRKRYGILVAAALSILSWYAITILIAVAVGVVAGLGPY